MTISKTFHLTKDGIDELTAELETLKKRRLKVADKLRAAKEQGDLSENSDWAAAQDEFKFVDGRINEIEHILQNASVIKAPADSSKVVLGSKVDLQQDGKKLHYHLVGSLESNPEEGKISDASPIGKALMGKQVGDLVDIVVPSGKTTYKIVK